MCATYFSALCFLILIGCEGHNDSAMEFYYNPMSHAPFRLISIENNLRRYLGHRPNQRIPTSIRVLHFRANACTCQENTCGCCALMKLEQFNFQREGCMNLSYVPSDFAINLNLLVDGNSISSNTLSAKNPPPFCVPLAAIMIPVPLEVCAKLFDIYTVGNNLHVCFDMVAKFEMASVLILHFDCMILGNTGPAIVKPGSTENTLSATTENQLGTDDFDEVTEVKGLKA